MNVFNAEALRKARLSKRITQTELGMRVGMSSASVCRIERGERLPTAAEIDALSKALDSMAMKEVEIPKRDFSVATRLAGLQHRIKVEISLEQIREIAGQAIGHDCLKASARQPSALVFYVPLDGLAIDNLNTEEEEDDTTTIRPRHR